MSFDEDPREDDCPSCDEYEKERLRLIEENKKLKDCVEYIHRRGYTGASFIASECLKEIENEERN